MPTLKWWQTAVFYQVYPRSFADGNGDGIGDFKGILSKLDYLKDLGVDALWLSPHFPSPNRDWGYDISDYCNVAPEYGTLDDFKAFLESAHARGLRVILDLVLNHTSDQHPWFLESKSSRDNPKADWYVWLDPPRPKGEGLGGEGAPLRLPPNSANLGGEKLPNNWQSCFDGPAWTYVPERDQYYYHYFMQQQPDLNWRNPEVKAAMWDAARFWLDMGVDGFRLDAIGTIFEDPALTPHNVPLTLAELRRLSETAQTPAEKKCVQTYWRDMFRRQQNGPGLHDLMKELRSILDEYPGERMLVGEDDNIDYMGNGNDELNLVFNFPLMWSERLTPHRIRRNQKERLSRLEALPVPGWPCNTLGNHDRPRMYSQFGDGQHNAELARLNLALMLTLKGTPFLYNGEEIGMSDYIITDPSRLRDTMATWYYDQMIHELHVEPAEAALRAGAMTRDKNRTPMQWQNAVHAGFCPAEVEPWLPVNPEYAQGINVEAQERDPDSLLSFYKRILAMRKETPALLAGEYRPLHQRKKEYLAFLRQTETQSVLVALNYSTQPHELRLRLPQKDARLLFSSAARASQEESTHAISIGPFEVYIAELHTAVT